MLQQQFDLNIKIPVYMQQEPGKVLIGTIWSGALDRLQAYYKPEHLYYRAFPTRTPIVALVTFIAQRKDTPYEEAISEFKPILNFWLDKGARVDAKDAYGQTALHMAVRLNPVLPLAEILLQRGADVNMQTRSGTTALTNCVAAGEVCHCLLTTSLSVKLVSSIMRVASLHLSSAFNYCSQVCPAGWS